MRIRSAKASWLLWGFVLFFAALMTARTFSKGWDFEVFWRVGRDFLAERASPYDLGLYGNMVFKYPPWVLPFFLPFALVPLSVAKILWGLVQGFSLFWVVKSVREATSSAKLDGSRADLIQAFVLLAFFGIWGVHGIVGQVSLPMLALAMGLVKASGTIAGRADQHAIGGHDDQRLGGHDERQLPKLLVALTALSAKTLTLFPFLAFLIPAPSGLAREGERADFLKKVVAWLGGMLILSLPIVFWSYRGDLGAMLHDWFHSNFSGTSGVNAIRIGFTTREAQGFPSLILRLGQALGGDACGENSKAMVLGAIAVSMAGVAAFALWALRGLSREIQWWGWLALTPTVQPLAWFHFYSFAYPLLAWAWIQAWAGEGRVEGNGEDRASAEPMDLARHRWMLAAATLLIAAVSQKTLGSFGLTLEMASVKSWGVVLLVLALRFRTVA